MQIHTSHEINASASAVWQVLGEEFGEVADWADGVVKSSMDGPVAEGAFRTCDIKAVGPVAAGKVVEKLTQFDREAQALTYLVTSGVPGFMSKVQNTWSVEELGDGRSRATSLMTVEVVWWAIPMLPIIRMQLKGTLAGLMSNLTTAVTSDTQADEGSAAHAGG